jgi:siroheme decarboxylase
MGGQAMTELTPFQLRLLDLLQEGLPICRRPFADIAASLGVSEMTVLSESASLLRQHIIRRIGPIIDYRMLGRVSTLATAHVPAPDIERVASTVSSLPGVSHNYLRDHHYNLWFTLQDTSEAAIENVLSGLSAKEGIAFHSLPAVHFFKLDVRFGNKRTHPEKKVSGTISPIQLTDSEKAILTELQHGIEVVTSPFAYADDDAPIVAAISSLLQRGVIKRIAATIDYRRLGFTANAMLCCRVAPEKVEEVGRALASLEMVSHCYERRTFPGWPFNLFAMMHAKAAGDINVAVAEFSKGHGITESALLPTLREFKKSPILL